MGPQSQRRLSLEARTYQLKAQASAAQKKRKGGAGQQTLFGDRAFKPEKDCVVCRAKLSGRTPHRSHHPLCWNNKRTKGIVSVTTLKQRQVDKSLRQHFSMPLKETEKGSSKHATKEAGQSFFARHIPLERNQEIEVAQPTKTHAEDEEEQVTAELFCGAVTAKINDSSFCREHFKGTPCDAGFCQGCCWNLLGIRNLSLPFFSPFLSSSPPAPA